MNRLNLINDGKAMSSKITTRYVLMGRNLEKLCKKAINDFFNGNFETLTKYVQERKKVVGIITSELGVYIVNDEKAFDFINQIYPNDKSLCGKLLDAIMEDQPYHLFQDDEISQMASDLFYSETCGEDYILNLLEIGKLILKLDVPENLHTFVEEARRCFALDRYLAVCALSRTIIESFLLYLCELVGEEPERDQYNHPIIGSIFEIVSKGDKKFTKRLCKLYNRTSRRIHGDKMIDRKKTKEIFQETISLVQDIYNFHRIK